MENSDLFRIKVETYWRDKQQNSSPFFPELEKIEMEVYLWNGL